jgi:hypothetical protein
MPEASPAINGGFFVEPEYAKHFDAARKRYSIPVQR